MGDVAIRGHTRLMECTVLIVDDDAQFRRVAAELLADRGYRVVGEAGTALAGWVRLGTAHAVVAYLHRELPSRRDADAGARGSGMLDHVRQCLADQEVDAGLDRCREALLWNLQRLDGDRDPVGQCL